MARSNHPLQFGREFFLRKYFSREGYLSFYRNKIIENEPKNGFIVHLGSGRDKYDIFTLRSVSANVISLDLDVKALQKNKNPKKLLANAEIMPIKNNSCDLIVSEHTFEHLEQPEKVMFECHRILKEGGAVIFACPNRLSYVSIIASVTPTWFHVFINRLRKTRDPEEDTFRTYYRMNTPGKIKKIAETYKFKVEQLEAFVCYPCYTNFLPIIHHLFIFWHVLLEKWRFLKMFRMSLVGILRKTRVEHD